MQRIIFHIDFDSFFASCEQQFSPALRNKPIGVTATNGRSCIIAASREAKALGIKSPSRTFDAQNIYPGIQFVSADFVKYYEISKKFLKICSDYSPYVEMFSLDEVFMDVTKTAHLFKGVDKLVQTIKERIKNEIGEYITASFGISYNKTLAKLASGLKKPNGVVEITKENINEVYNCAKLTDVCGIGERIKVRLNKIGVYKLIHLKTIPFHLLLSEFGRMEAYFLKSVGEGLDSSVVVPYYEAPEVKSVGRNYCLPHNEYNLRVVVQNIYELCEEVGIKLRRLNKKARKFGVFLTGSCEIGFNKTYGDYFNTGSEMFQFFKREVQNIDFFKTSFPRHSGKAKPHPESENDPGQVVIPQGGARMTGLGIDYVRQIRVWAGNLENSNNLSLSLFDEKQKLRKVIEATDRLNEKYGDHTIRNAYLLYADKLTTVPNGFGADRYDKTKLAIEASAGFV